MAQQIRAQRTGRATSGRVFRNAERRGEHTALDSGVVLSRLEREHKHREHVESVLLKHRLNGGHREPDRVDRSPGHERDEEYRDRAPRRPARA